MSDDGPSPRSSPRCSAASPSISMSVEVMRHGHVWDGSTIRDAHVEQAAQAAFSAASPEAVTDCEMAVVLTDDEEMRDLNRTWRGKDAPTNVLSFPANAPSGGLLGDVVIAYETTRAEAKHMRIPLTDHVSHLVVHGVLHLLGYDHLDDGQAERMEDLERKALASLRIADPYGCADAANLAETS